MASYLKPVDTYFTRKLVRTEKLYELISKHRIFDLSLFTRSSPDVVQEISSQYSGEEIKNCISKYAAQLKYESWRDKITSGKEGLAYRWQAMDNFLRNDQSRGAIHAEFDENPFGNLKAGTLFLLRISQANNFPMFYNTIEDILSQYSTIDLVALQGSRSDSGAGMVADMLMRYVPHLSVHEDLYLPKVPPTITMETASKKLHECRYLSIDVEHTPINGCFYPNFDFMKNRHMLTPSIIICLEDVWDGELEQSQIYEMNYSVTDNDYRIMCIIAGTERPVQLTPFHYITALSIEQMNQNQATPMTIEDIDILIANFATLFKQYRSTVLYNIQLDNMTMDNTFNIVKKHTSVLDNIPNDVLVQLESYITQNELMTLRERSKRT
ncbi:hypothetical protein CcNV_018 [Crangon crangon nudivirus]|uniref:F-box domain-containing protein n=1 Tax=Crangon crangon nudivirus TaxID=2880838 RepID=A0AAE8Y2B4_9VIRU|nr:hypothetical protein QKT25_gp018 [Crangon crangon nudivirus]UBZ25502.1 hypothetical protein CcNV_018 [Crangon crangon nudivirus]